MSSTWSAVFGRPWSPPELVRDTGDGKLKYGATRLVLLYPQAAAMGVDDGSADRQPYAHPIGFRGVKWLEHTLELVRDNPRSGVVHRYDGIGLRARGTDQQIPWPILQ